MPVDGFTPRLSTAPQPVLMAMRLPACFAAGLPAGVACYWGNGWGRLVQRLVILGVVVLPLLCSHTVSYAQVTAGCGQLVHPVAGPTAAPVLSTNPNLVTIEDSLYFVASHGTEPAATKYLWQTDGTPTGTFTLTATLADFTPNYLLTALNGNLLLRASTPATGAELWRSDGTTVGTQLLKELAPGAAGVTYAGWFVFGGRFFFAVYDEVTTRWWVTDGTAAKTVPLTTLYPGTTPVNAQVLAQSPTELYMTAHVSDREAELWRFDRRGFRKVKSFSGTATSRAATVIGQALLQNGNLYFWASVAGGPSGLWRSDGTSAGTTLLWEKAFVAQTAAATDGGVYPHTLVAGGPAQLFFFEADPPLLRLWQLRQPAEALTLVKTIRARSTDGVYYDIQYDNAIAYNQTLYFALGWHDRRANATHTELWQSDGTPTGTSRLTPLPMSTRLAFGAPQGLVLVSPSNLVALPWEQPYPTVICNFDAPFLLSPSSFYQQGQLYLTGRKTGADTARLWRLDLTTWRPTTVFLPLIENNQIQ